MNTTPYPQLPTFPDKEKALKIAIVIASVAVTALVVLMRYVKLPVPKAGTSASCPPSTPRSTR